MPCASVSEKPTRVSAEYLNGGFAPVARPSSSLISRVILRRHLAAPMKPGARHGPGTCLKVSRFRHGSGQAAVASHDLEEGVRIEAMHNAAAAACRRLGGEQRVHDRFL